MNEFHKTYQKHVADTSQRKMIFDYFNYWNHFRKSIDMFCGIHLYFGLGKTSFFCFNL